MLRRSNPQTRINIATDLDIECWAERWKVPAFEIRRAIDRAGPLVADVARSLQSFRRADILAGRREGRD